MVSTNLTDTVRINRASCKRINPSSTEQSSPGRNRRCELTCVNPFSLSLYKSYEHTTRAQHQPGKNISRKITVNQQDFIAVLPPHSIRQQVQAIRCAVSEDDVIRRCSYKLGKCPS
jgi:hypothetical protein